MNLSPSRLVGALKGAAVGPLTPPQEGGKVLRSQHSLARNDAFKGAAVGRVRPPWPSPTRRAGDRSA